MQYADSVMALGDRLSCCKTSEELDTAFDQALIESALGGAEGTLVNDMLLTYWLFAERIQEELPTLPTYYPSESDLEKAATHLGAVYLKRIGFLLYHRESAAGLHMRINPCHPIEQTIGDLKRRLPILHDLACFVLERDRPILELARSIGPRPGDALDASLQEVFGRPLPNDAPH